MQVNSVTLVGLAANDPEVSYFESGSVCANASTTAQTWSLWCRLPDGRRLWHHQHTSADRLSLIARAAALAKTFPDHEFTVISAQERPEP